MQVETRSNGTIQIHLKPEGSIERAVVDTLLEGAEKGRAVRLVKGEDGSAVLEMDK